jgi:hypothetical protein
MGKPPLRGINKLGLVGAVVVPALAQTVAARKWRPLAVAACLALVAAGALAASNPRALTSGVPARLAGTSFDPESVTFASLGTGWALGTTQCAPGGTCLALRETTDAGRSWSPRPLPASLVAVAGRKVGGVPADCCGAGLNVRFADLRDGWIYGGLVVPSSYGGSIEPTLWSTHDGGLTWREQPLPGLATEGSVLDLEAAAGSVYFMAQNNTTGVTVESSPVAQDNWHAALGLGDNAGGAEPSGTIVLHGSSGWLVEGNDRGTAGSARLDPNGQWVGWAPPCASVGHSFAVPAASTSSNLVAVCVMGGFAYPLSRAAPPGATLGSSWLYFSNNGGQTFETGPELGPRGDVFGDVLASPVPGVILLSRAYFGNGDVNEQDLRASFDGGHHWTVVYRGQLLYLGFTSPAQGVGIVQSSKSTTTMIMTFDGGDHWAPVTF